MLRITFIQGKGRESDEMIKQGLGVSISLPVTIPTSVKRKSETKNGEEEGRSSFVSRFSFVHFIHLRFPSHPFIQPKCLRTPSSPPPPITTPLPAVAPRCCLPKPFLAPAGGTARTRLLVPVKRVGREMETLHSVVLHVISTSPLSRLCGPF